MYCTALSTVIISESTHTTLCSVNNMRYAIDSTKRYSFIPVRVYLAGFYPSECATVEIMSSNGFFLATLLQKCLSLATSQHAIQNLSSFVWSSTAVEPVAV